MIDGLGPYPEYRDSGVSWLGRVPAHWQLKRGKALFGESQLPVRESDEIVTCFRDGQVTLRRNRRTTGFMIALKEAGYQGVRKGQLVIHAMDAFAGAIGISDSDGKCTPEYIVCEPRHPNIEPAYFAQALRLAAWQRYIEVSCNAVRERAPRLRYPNFGAMVLPVPASAEQTAIVRFLAHADHRIRRYIRAKQRLITLLEEQKQAIIHQAVTRGLDPNVDLKPSGIPWLGEIPSGWSLRRFKRVVRITRGQVDPRTEEQRGKILLAPNHIRRGDGAIIALESAEAQGADSGKYEVRAGQVVYSKIRPMLRKAAIAPTDCLCSADMYPLTIDETQVRREFFLQLLLSEPFTRYAVDCSLRVAMPKVNREALGDAWLWHPPIGEQIRIESAIASETRTASKAIDATRTDVRLLREYRTRLIADVVTGQLDVRAAAAALPDEPDDPTPLDDTDLTESEDDADPDSEANPDAEAIASDD